MLVATKDEKGIDFDTDYGLPYSEMISQMYT
jgi:hypothetical protein